MPAFLFDCKSKWTDLTGAHPDSDRTQQELFRKAVLAGVSEDVQDAMRGNPDMVGCDTATWEKHLSHHYRRYQEKKAKAEADVAESQQQLLKLLS